MDRFRSLTARLVLTTVALVALVCLLIAGATTLAMRAYLNGRLDDEVREAVARTLTDRPGPGDEPGRFTAVGSLRANFPEGQAANGYVITAQGDEPPHREDLGSDQLATLDEIPADGDAHDADVPDLGEYRVIATRVTFVMEGGTTAPGVVVVGLPSDEVDGIISSLVGWEALLTLLGVVAAGSAALVVVRRQLRPLREVAATAHAVSELPLASGAIALEERVPAHLTDERTEVGQVGSALNAMLDHVGSSLEARHRSEQQVRQFVADASHELRTPLTTIAGYTELARSRPDDRAAADTALAKVEEESGRMTALVEDLLLLARLDSGRPLRRRARRPHPSSRRGGLGCPCARPGPPLAVVAARVLGRGRRRRAAPPPGRHQPPDQRAQVHPRGHHGHRVRRTPAASPSTTTAPASRPTWSTRPSSASPAETPRAPAPATSRESGAATAWACPWSRPSSPPMAAGCTCGRYPATRP